MTHGPSLYTFVLKLTDRPGGMELIAATFAHRGVSLSTSLGNDGTLDPQGRATVLITFAATPAKKEALKGALGRLSRVSLLVEHPAGSPTLRTTAVVRLAAGAPVPVLPPDVVGLVEKTNDNVQTGDTTYLVVGPPDAVDALLAQLRAQDYVRDVMHTVIAL